VTGPTADPTAPRVDPAAKASVLVESLPYIDENRTTS